MVHVRHLRLGVLPLLGVALGEHGGQQVVLVAEVVQQPGVGDSGPLSDVAQ